MSCDANAANKENFIPNNHENRAFLNGQSEDLHTEIELKFEDCNDSFENDIKSQKEIISSSEEYSIKNEVIVDLKPFTCDVCYTSFTEKVDLYMHKDMIHDISGTCD